MIEDEIDQKDRKKNKKNYTGIFKYIYRFFKFILRALAFPLMLLLNLMRLINELRMLMVSIFTILVILILFLLYTIIFKPAWAWEPLKSFLNDDIKLEVVKEINLDDIYKKIDALAIKTDNIGMEFQVPLNENEVTQLFRKSNLMSIDGQISVEKNLMRIYTNIDSLDKPLWLIVEAKKIDNGNIKIDDIGFQRINFPDFLSGFVNSSYSSMSDILAKQNGKDNSVILYNQVLDKSKFKYTLNRVEFIQDNIILYSSVTN